MRTEQPHHMVVLHFERMDEAEFARRFGDTPLARPGLAGMRRNLPAALASIRTGAAHG